MSRKNRVPLAERVTKAAEATLAAQQLVSTIDVLVGLGWLDPRAVGRWRRGEIDCLEEIVYVDLPRIAEAMRLPQAMNSEFHIVEYSDSRPTMQTDHHLDFGTEGTAQVVEVALQAIR